MAVEEVQMITHECADCGTPDDPPISLCTSETLPKRPLCTDCYEFDLWREVYEKEGEDHEYTS